MGHSAEVNSLCPAIGHSEFTSALCPTLSVSSQVQPSLIDRFLGHSKHEGVELQPVSVHAFGHAQGKEIFVSCPGCKDIKVMDLETGLTTVVFNRNGFMPDDVLR